MRAGMVLEALSANYRVSLLVITAPHHEGHKRDVPAALSSLCESVKVLEPGGDMRDKMRRAAEACVGQQFDVVHVFRLSTVGYAQPYLKAGPAAAARHLDLDDIDSKTKARLAELYRQTGRTSLAGREEQNVKRLELLEAVAFRTFDRIYVCSESDRREILARCACLEGSQPDVCVLPNAVRRLAGKHHDRVFRFLFVGSMAYFPNEDAVRFFCSEVLPIIRTRAAVPVMVDVVGELGTALAGFAAPNVNVLGAVEDVAPYYQGCDAVVVPIRAGGGSRIKILEAFSYGRPVVTTTIGVENIDARPNHDVLVADTPDSFASACLDLMYKPDLRQTLVESAGNLLERLYTLDRMKGTLSGMPVHREPRA